MQILRRSRSRRAPRLAPRLLATGAAVTATAAIGSLATGPAVRSPEYTHLDKPSWQPPGVAFPIVWTGLYTVIACTSALALTNLARHHERAQADEHELVPPQRPRVPARRSRPLSRQLSRRRAGLRRSLAVNLALNAGWCWTFFRAREFELASVHAAVLTLSCADLSRRAGSAHRGAGAALVPYVLWCGFATALSTSIARRNPRR